MMSRKASLTRHVLALLVTALMLLSARPSSAQTIAESSYEYTFGQQATFSLTLPQDTDSDATIFLQINGGRTDSYPVPLHNGRGTYIHNLSKTPFPAFANITYWWMYQDAQGNDHSTAKQTFLYEDNRYRWQALSGEDVILHWVAGDTNIMAAALDVAQQAHNDLQKYLRAPSGQTVQIYIYPSGQDLQSALRLARQTWVGGVARPETGVVLVTLPPNANAFTKMKRDIPHEMTHKALYDLLGPQGYESLPLWLDEGLASTFEQSPDSAYSEALEQARQSNTLLPLTSLCKTLPTDRPQIILAYAQMQSFVSYLVETQGWSKLRQLLNSYADGLGCSAGVEHVYGQPLPTLEHDWRVWLAQGGDGASFQAALRVTLHDLAPWLLLLLLIGLPVFIPAIF